MELEADERLDDIAISPVSHDVTPAASASLAVSPLRPPVSADASPAPLLEAKSPQAVIFSNLVAASHLVLPTSNSVDPSLRALFESLEQLDSQHPMPALLELSAFSPHQLAQKTRDMENLAFKLHRDEEAALRRHGRSNNATAAV